MLLKTDKKLRKTIIIVSIISLLFSAILNILRIVESNFLITVIQIVSIALPLEAYMKEREKKKRIKPTSQGKTYGLLIIAINALIMTYNLYSLITDLINK